MKIIREVPKEEVIQILMKGGGTTWQRVSDSQREYVCRYCGRTFFSSGLIFHDLCDEDFGVFNISVFSHRLRGDWRYKVADWIKEMNEENQPQ